MPLSPGPVFLLRYVTVHHKLPRGLVEDSQNGRISGGCCYGNLPPSARARLLPAEKSLENKHTQLPWVLLLRAGVEGWLWGAEGERGVLRDAHMCVITAGEARRELLIS